jgi:mycofactocin precursor
MEHDRVSEALPDLQSPGEIPAPPPNGRPKLDLSRITPPERLEAVRVEELTIDGICGVY